MAAMTDRDTQTLKAQDVATRGQYTGPVSPEPLIKQKFELLQNARAGVQDEITRLSERLGSVCRPSGVEGYADNSKPIQDMMSPMARDMVAEAEQLNMAAAQLRGITISLEI